jgi:ubiquinone/menaquinone biosynthesis C-methylase UbiE
LDKYARYGIIPPDGLQSKPQPIKVSRICLSKERTLPSIEIKNRFETKLKYAHFSKIRESLQQIAAVPPGSQIKVVDLACGPGNMALFCDHTPAMEWFGLELWPNELRQAADTDAYTGLVQANLVQRLPLKKHTADAIILNEILMYLENSPELLAELFHVIKPSGMLYVYNPIYTVPTLLSRLKKIGRRIRRSDEAVAFDCEYDWRKSSRASRINFYSFDSLVKEIQEAGFEILEITGFRIFRNRIRLMREFENFQWYREITKRFAHRNPRLASDILVIARKP